MNNWSTISCHHHWYSLMLFAIVFEASHSWSLLSLFSYVIIVIINIIIINHHNWQHHPQCQGQHQQQKICSDLAQEHGV